MTGVASAGVRGRHAATDARRRPSLGLLRLIAATATLLPLLALSYRESLLPQDVRKLAGLLWVLALTPSWLYLRLPRHRRPPIPFVPLAGVLYGAYFALPAVIGVDNTYGVFLPSADFAPLDPVTDYRRPVELALLGWCALLLSYYALGTLLRVPVPRAPTTASLNARAIRTWGLRLLVGGLAVELLQAVVPVPLIVRGLASFAVVLSRFGAALLVVLAVRGYLARGHRWALYVGVATMFFLTAGTGSTLNSALVALFIFLAVWIGGGHLSTRWVLAGALSTLLFISMRGVALDFRLAAWYTTSQVTVSQRTVLMARLLAARAAERGLGVVTDGWEAMAARSANLDVLADVVRQTPESVPYWRGQTYVSLIGIAVPRFLWPSKPTKMLGQEFGHRYRYLYPTDTHTSINLPFLVEFYANFGELGILFGMLLVGVIYRVLERYVNRPGQSVLVSVAALALLSPLLGIEGDFSLIFGGLVLNGVALYAVLNVVRRSARMRPAGSGVPPSRRVAGPLRGALEVPVGAPGEAR